MMSDIDAHTIESYLEANAKSVPMRELANSVIKSRMQNLLRQTTTKPAEQMLPLNPTNRQHQLFHKLAVEEKSLPKAMRASPTPTVKRNQNTPFKAKKNFKFNKQAHGTPYHQSAGRKQQFPQKKQFSGAPRPRVNQNQQQASRGAQKPKPQNGNSKLAKNPADAVAQLRNAYDITKISDQLEHFGSTTPEVQLMLQHQLVQRSLDVAPNPKKPSVTPSSDN